MSALPPSRRFFQRSFPRPCPKLAPPPKHDQVAEPTARKYFYGSLMRVAFRNGYYPEPEASPDFSVRPTDFTAELMQRLGLLFRAGAAGFAVLYDERRTASLLSFLKREAIPMGSPEEREAWTRLSFVVRLENPFYLNFTDLPLDFEPTASNLYFSNRAAHRRRGMTLLNPGSHVTGEEILPLVPGQLPVPVRDDVEELRVLAISGRVVQCRPRCVPAAATLRMPPDQIPCSSPPESPVICRDRVYLDFSILPEDSYTVEAIGPNPAPSWQVLSSAASPLPFAFIDLLLAQPRQGEPGIYPVRGLWSPEPVIAGVDYQLVFRRRSTFWRYFVVLPRDCEREGLKIERVSGPRVRFWGPEPVVLGDGTPASLFTSRRPLPLQARPDVHLLLRSDAGVLLDPLPVASSRQVLPAPAVIPPTTRAFSDIYVYV